MTDTPPAVRRYHWYSDGMWSDDDPLPGDPRPTRGKWNIADEADAALAALESELVEAKAKLDWRPIETAPRDGTRVMLGWPGGGVRYGFYLNNTNWKGWRGPSMELPFPSPPPTHWMPLPAPPKDAALRDGTKGEL